MFSTFDKALKIMANLIAHRWLDPNHWHMREIANTKEDLPGTSGECTWNDLDFKSSVEYYYDHSFQSIGLV